MVLITPRLVRPLDPDEVPPLPTTPRDFLPRRAGEPKGEKPAAPADERVDSAGAADASDAPCADVMSGARSRARSKQGLSMHGARAMHALECAVASAAPS